MGDVEHIYETYNDIHTIIAKSAAKIADEFKPDMLIAIGGGGFFPARVLRTFLKDPASKRNIPIQAIGLSLYESLPGTTEEQIGQEVIRTQWLGPEAQVLLGRRALIVDEVDDSRKTLHYAVSELQKDVEAALQKLPEAERDGQRTKFAVFVVHNKLKEKVADLPPDIPYYSGAHCTSLHELVRPFDRLDYPWEATDIEEHDRLAAEARAKGK